LEERFRSLYPPIEPYNTGKLKVGDIHEIYYEQSGNPDGKPALVLHGGPGAGSDPSYRSLFDPSVYRVIQFDQRGCGQSTPHASLEENTTWHLVEDIERIRNLLKIEKWVVLGGSWGSTLALAYAQKYPARVKALILRGIFTLKREELNWFYQEGASFCFPDAFEKYLEPIPKVERGHMMSAYYRRLTGSDEKEKVRCAKAWSLWEMTTSRLFVDQKNLDKAEKDDFAVPFARIECHYFVNGGFMEYDGQLIQEATKLANIPGVIVHGRYDMVCPLKTAWDLQKVWTAAELNIIPDAGHSWKETGTLDILIRSTDKFRDL